ncbi:MAG: aa3-type cytochrome c oxidase subunit IV [Alphaproteobacteria bacterium]|nr:aa3-type cytochrome c oxidase subunit IV [Alphaproteobacteria bacterium]MCY4317963.1 aa3-type cytochrome c oxidase subunit IV [Alphaproteobacteria bacterium]
MADYKTAAENARHQNIWAGFCRFLGWSTGGVVALLVILAATLL